MAEISASACIAPTREDMRGEIVPMHPRVAPTLHCPECGSASCLGPLYCPRASHATPRKEGNPVMNEAQQEIHKDEGTLPALLNELEELNSELQCELQCLDGAVDRLGAHSQPQDCPENNKTEPAPETHLARLHHQIIRLRNLRDETRELNRRLAEAV